MLSTYARSHCLSLLGMVLFTSNYSLAQPPRPQHLNYQQHPVQPNLPLQQNCNAPSLPAPTFPSQLNISHLDLDYIYDKDPKQLQNNLNQMIQRLNIIKPNTVFLQAFADPDGNGSADQVYFKNRHVPLRQNLLPMIIKEIRTKTQVDIIFAWLPLLAWEIKTKDLIYVQHAQNKRLGYHRLSPFVNQNLQIISQIYADFAQHVAVDGILFHDDITLNDFEDANPQALKTYQQWGFSKNYVFEPLQKDQQRFSEYKTEYLDQLAYAMAEIVKCQQPNIKTARNTYAPINLDRKTEQWFAQSVTSTLKYYNFNAIMAMPYMEKSDNHQRFYRTLIQAAKQYDPKLNRTIFELQAKDWENNQPIATSALIQDMQYLKHLGAQHLGYYPDDFINHHPDPKSLHNFFNHAD